MLILKRKRGVLAAAWTTQNCSLTETRLASLWFVRWRKKKCKTRCLTWRKTLRVRKTTTVSYCIDKLTIRRLNPMTLIDFPLASRRYLLRSIVHAECWEILGTGLLCHIHFITANMQCCLSDTSSSMYVIYLCLFHICFYKFVIVIIYYKIFHFLAFLHISLCIKILYM